MIVKGRKVIVEQDGAGRISITIDNGVHDVAVFANGKSEAEMRATGHVKLLERWPEARVHPLSTVALDLVALWVEQQPRPIPPNVG